MKKTMSKKVKRTESANRRGLEIDENAVRIQRTVRDDEAFHFYEAIGKPTGEIARNLPEFLGKVRTAKQESLMFHHLRGDFQNWVGKTLGDSKLAQKLQKISSSNGDDVRTKIGKTVESRLKELNESSPAILVDESLAVLAPSS